MADQFPILASLVFDTTDADGLAEVYRRLLGYAYRAGDEPPPPGEPDPAGRDWLVLIDAAARVRLASQQVDHLVEATWSDGTVPQQLHLDLRLESTESLLVQHERAVVLGTRVLLDRRDDPTEPLSVYADPAGHPFCIFALSAWGPTFLRRWGDGWSRTDYEGCWRGMLSRSLPG